VIGPYERSLPARLKNLLGLGADARGFEVIAFLPERVIQLQTIEVQKHR